MSKSFPYKIDILYQDKDIVAINKPAGLMVHPDGRSEGPFLTDWIVKKFPKTVKVGETMYSPEGDLIVRPGVIHRLDRETSGVMLVALTKAGHAHLKEQFKARTILKKYITFVWGELNEEFGTITRPIGRSGSDFRKWSAQRGTRGDARKAETYWTKLGELKEDKADGTSQKYTLIEAEPKTGRTHQIRVHFVAIHHPVVGDKLYAEKRAEGLGFERVALHARSIMFENVKGEKVKVEAPMPEDFERVCEEYKIRIK